MPEFRLGWYRGKLAAVWNDEKGKRCRHSLGTADQALARARLAEYARVYTLETTGAPVTVGAIFQAYVGDRSGDGKPVVRMQDAWKRLAPTFGPLLPGHVNKHAVRGYTQARATAGASRGTVHLELTYLRAALRHAEREGWVARAPFIPLPVKPKPKDHYLTKAEAAALLEAAAMPHVRLFITLALATGGRASAILGLTWQRVNFARGTIDLRDPTLGDTPKGRALVPMNEMARAALEQARGTSISDYVIEWGGKPVRSVKKGMAAAAARAGLEATPHVLRHTAAVWMAEAEVPMEEIAQYLGHSSTATTYRVYARYSPGHLRKAANALEL